MFYEFHISEKGVDKLSTYDLLKNAELFKKLYVLKEKADTSMKNYLGLDVGRFKKEIVDEYNKNPDVNGKTILTVRHFLHARPSSGFERSTLRYW